MARRRVVATSSGKVAGLASDGIARFLGIPYAAAPVDALRFQAPQPHPGWAGVREATEPGPTPLLPPASPTSSIPEIPTAGDEFLNLNITAPAAGLSGEGTRPVYVWVHGGSFVAGSPNGGWFDGATYARADVVVVVVTYRLGFEGFGHIDGAPDNRAVLDLIVALEWVQQNIAAFGGDPDLVTLGGQSAGGALVLSLLASPHCRGLFRAAVVHSAPLPDITAGEAQRVTATMARDVGIDAAATLDQWRQISREQIVAAERQQDSQSTWESVAELRRTLARHHPVTRFGPIVGTDLVPQVLPALAAPDQRPLLIGATSSEFNPATEPLERALGAVTPGPVLLAAGLPAALARAYPRAYPEMSAAQLLGQALTDRLFRMTAVQVANARVDAGAPVALWDFRWHPQGGPARHCIDLPFAWDVLDADRVDRIAGDEPPAALTRDIGDDITAFIRSAVAPWAGYERERPTAKVYDTPCWVGRDPYRFERIGVGVVADSAR